MYLLDTDTIVYWLNGEQSIERKAQSVGLDKLYYSIISKAELYFGAYNSTYVQQNLGSIVKLSQTIAMLPFDDKAAQIFGQQKADLKKSGQILLDADICIAATALANGLTLVTNNRRHFGRIKNLPIENWKT